jgi:hypothetical protein
MSNQTTPTSDAHDYNTATDREQPQIATTHKDKVATRASIFKVLDNIVVDGQLSFRKVGPAFRRIKSEKLWKESTSGWTKYCESRGSSSTHANRVIQAAKADDVIRNALQNLPDSEYPRNEWQIRPLVSSLSDSEIVDSWKLALDIAKDRKPIQKNVRAAVKQILREDDDEKPEKKPNKKAEILARIARLRALIAQREQSPETVSFEKVEEAFICLKAAV